MKRRRLRPEDRHITASECHALIVHTINQLFDAIRESQASPLLISPDVDLAKFQLQDVPAPYQDVNPSPDEPG